MKKFAILAAVAAVSSIAVPASAIINASPATVIAGEGRRPLNLLISPLPSLGVCAPGCRIDPICLRFPLPPDAWVTLLPLARSAQYAASWQDRACACSARCWPVPDGCVGCAALVLKPVRRVARGESCAGLNLLAWATVA